MRFDRVRCGNSLGITMEIFDAPWWRLDRWFVWFFRSKGHAKGRVTMTVSGVSRSVRCRSVDRNPSRPVYVPNH